MIIPIPSDYPPLFSPRFLRENSKTQNTLKRSKMSFLARRRRKFWDPKAVSEFIRQNFGVQRRKYSVSHGIGLIQKSNLCRCPILSESMIEMHSALEQIDILGETCNFSFSRPNEIFLFDRISSHLSGDKWIPFVREHPLCRK
jgi:hypothetical protein